MSTSHKNPAGACVTAFVALFLAGCAGGEMGTTPDSSFGDGSSGVREPALDFGENWDDSWIRDLEREDGRPGARVARGGDDDGPAGIAGQRRSYWGVTLKSFSATGHPEAAANMVRSCGQIDPRLARAHVHTTGNGSVVVYGVYEEPSSQRAQDDLKWIKGLKLHGKTVFPRALLSRITVGPDPDRMNPLALMSARRRFPNLNPLYTLEVAVWGDFGNARISQEEIRRRGAHYAQELRSQGHEAYFHYDDNTELCMVTVGLYDHSAIDPQSGLLAPEVEASLKNFPAHLVNGEPLQEQIDPKRPHLGTRVQRPQLVMVPK